jgi:hypothetical protein
MDETATIPLDAPQTPMGGLLVSTAIHPADAFTADGRPVFPARIRNLPPAIIRTASFSIALAGQIADGRAPHETTVAGCEGARCAIAYKPSKEPSQ